MTEKHKPESITNESASGNPQLAKAMEEYLAELESGIQPNRERFLTLYPDIAVELAACLEGLDFIHCVAPQLKDAGRGQSQAPERIHPLATVGDFRIVRELGRGGMGVVYEAEQLSLGRTVALKVLPFAAMLDERQLKRFQNEARVMASLDHPHIVAVHGFGVDRCVHYYAMRLIEGQSLDHVLRDLQRRAAKEKLSTETTGSLAAAESTNSNPRPYDLPDDFSRNTEDRDRVNMANETGGTADSEGRTEYDSPSIHASRRDTVANISTQISPADVGYYRYVARIGMQAAEALGYAHDNGVLHRDIKPGNLLLDSRGWLWVSDFGLAQIKSDLRLTGIGDVVGTLRYMSPEQLMGKTLLVDQRSDIYSLGATLYELTTLRPLFDASDRRELLRQVGVEEAPSPRQINKRIPVALSTIINKCIQKDPADRYAIAQDVADDLGRFLQDQPIIARPPNLHEKAARWLRHHRSLAWTATAFIAVPSCGLAASVVWISQERVEAVRQRNASQEQKTIVLAREESLRRFLYATDMRLAWQNWRNAFNNMDMDQIRHLLSRHETMSNQEDLSSFAWFYMKGLCGQTPLAVLSGHDGRVYHVAFSPDGKTLATASQDKTAKLWDLDTRQLRHTLRGHMGEVNCVAFAPNGQSLATASDDRTVKFWNPFDGKETFTQVLPEFKMPVHRVEFSTDGKQLMAGEVSEREDDGAATLWNLSTGRQQVRLEGHFPLGLSPDSTMLATTNNDSAVRLWNVADSQEHAVLTGHTGKVRTGIFSTDSPILVTGDDDGIVRLWGANGGPELHYFLLWQNCSVHSATYSPDQMLLVAGDEDGAVTFWDTNSGRRLTTRGANTARVRTVRFTPDGGTLVSASDDSTVKIWDITEILGMKPIPDQADPITSIRFISNSELLSASNGKQPGLRYNVRTGAVLSLPWNETNGDELCVAFSPSKFSHRQPRTEPCTCSIKSLESSGGSTLASDQGSNL